MIERDELDLSHSSAEPYDRVKFILDRRRADLNRVVAELIKRETLERPELEKLLTPSVQVNLGETADKRG